MAIVLIGAALVSISLNMLADASFILIVVLANVVIGGVQELAADKSAEGLKRRVPRWALVIREGAERRIAAEAVVPGDLIRIQGGDRVPADLQLVETSGLRIDESALTGESLPAVKDASALCDPEAPPAERLDRAFAGTTTLAGSGIGEAIATGMNTEIGRIAGALASEPEVKPPLVARMETFTWRILIAISVAMVLIFFLAVAEGRDAADMLLLCVALGVSAVPEGLPAAVAITLAVGVRRMAERNVIVRRLMAVESLGSCTMIASDKTGTLTANELALQRIVTATGQSFSLEGVGASLDRTLVQDRVQGRDRNLVAILQALTLANEARQIEENFEGDAVDAACLRAATQAGIRPKELLEVCPRLHLIPYDSATSFSAAVHLLDGIPRTFVKGSPERVLAMCSTEAGAHDRQPLNEEAAHRSIRELAQDGFRVLAVAEGGVDEGGRPLQSDLTWLGLVGMIDPARAEVPDAIAAAKRAGIEVAMVTGDHPVTALAIARRLGMAEHEEEVVTGREIRDRAKAGLEELSRLVEGRRVFARIEPTQKREIVAALRARGHFVAVTGDGINDAPALKAAHVGVAMGRRGTDVARDNADLILTDDNFASIIGGVLEGRVAYANIRKVVYMLTATGVAEVLLVILALFTGLPLPLLPVQLLWLNLVTNGIQDVALSFDPAEGDELDKPPRRPDEAIFDRRMTWRVFSSGIYMGAVAFLLFWALLETGHGEVQARNLTLLAMVLFENIQAILSRSEYFSLGKRHLTANPFLVWSVFLALGLHILAMHWSVTQEMLHLIPPDVGDFLAVMIASLVGLPILDAVVKTVLGRATAPAPRLPVK